MHSETFGELIIKNFEIIGEATYQLSSELKDKYHRWNGVRLPPFGIFWYRSITKSIWRSFGMPGRAGWKN